MAPADEPQNSDYVPKLQAWGVFIGAVAIPLVLVVVSNNQASTTRANELRLSYLEMAVAIINGERRTETAALNDWAVELLAQQSQSVLPLSEKAKQELRATRISLAGPNVDWLYDGPAYGGDYGYFDDSGPARSNETTSEGK